MMRVEGPALDLIRSSLGLLGPEAQITEYPDGVLSPVHEVSSLIRRSRAPTGVSPTGGLWNYGFQNVHAGVSTIVNGVDVYALLAATNGFPSPVPPQFDVWLLANFLLLSTPALDTGIAVVRVTNSANGAIISNTDFPVGAWSSSATLATTIFGAPYPVGGPPMLNTHAHRIPRAVSGLSNLLLQTTSTGIVTCTLQCLLGVFPAGMGYDA